MALQDDCAKTGDLLFRWRSYLPLVFIVVFIPAFQEFSYPFCERFYQQIWGMFCFAIALFGLFIRGYTIGYTPKNTSGINTKGQVADTLNTTGIYSVTRNPLYLGNFFMMLGVSLFVHIWWFTVIFTLSYWLYYERIIIAEEIFLTEKFGKPYENYARSTPAFLPDFKRWQPSELSFSMRNVLKREYTGFFAVIAAFALLQWIGDYKVQRAVVFDPVWTGLFILGLLAYITLRTLKKTTTLLDVEGR